MKTKLIVNPKAGAGKAQTLWPKLKPRYDFLKPYDEVYTTQVGETTPLTRQALKLGYDRILIVGGDGSLTEAVNGFFDNGSPLAPNAVLGTVPLGTGSDFLKSFGIFTLDDALNAMKKNTIQSCDMGQVTYVGKDHQMHQKLFLNIASFGCAGKIVDDVNRSSKPIGATLTYLGITLFTFLTYSSPVVELEIDGKETRKYKISNLFICNGKFSGSGMEWGPKANPTDGLFDLTIVQDIAKLKGLIHMPKVYQGRALDVPGVLRIQCHSLKATSQSLVQLEVDGDTIGTLPVSFEIFPHSIRMWGVGSVG